MKRKLSFIVALLALATCAFAQPEAGTFSLTPKVGINASLLTGNVYDRGLDIKGEVKVSTIAESFSKAGFVGGVEAGYQVSKCFAVTAGLLYSQQGAEREGALDYPKYGGIKDKSKLTLSYLNIPILANVYLFKGFAVKAGIQPGFLLDVNDKIDRTTTGAVRDENPEKGKINKDDCNTFDFSIPVGLSYEFYNIVIDARYNFGMTETLKKYASGRNSVFQLTLGYKFNL